MEKNSLQKLVIGKNPTCTARVVLTGVRSAFIGPNLIFEAHRTAVATIVIGLDADLALRWIEDEGAEKGRYPVIVIPPGTLCDLQADGDIALLFCDALRDNYSEIDLSGIEQKIQGLRELLKTGPQERSPDCFLEEVFGQLGVISDNATRPEITRVVSALGREPELFMNVEIAADLAGLSSMRFQHVFTETLGMPFRRYRQWRRMGSVIRALAEGKNLTEAAFASGFSNSAHFSTAFKAMFGLRPSDLLGSNVEYYLADLDGRVS